MNKQKGNMYAHVTHTCNPLAGQCPHQCGYCSTNKFYYPVLKQKYSGAPRLSEKAMTENLGSGNKIFMVAQNDLFAQAIPAEFIEAVIARCKQFPGNQYLFQTKNPARVLGYNLPEKSIVCTTIETNRWYPAFMGLAPYPEERALAMGKITRYERHVTIEPVIDFDPGFMLKLIRKARPQQVNIGANTGRLNLPEPSKEKLEELIFTLSCMVPLVIKDNLSRLLK